MWTEIKGRVCLAPAHLLRLNIGAVSTAMPRPPETITKETTVHPKETTTLKTSVSFTLSKSETVSGWICLVGNHLLIA